MTGAKLIGLGVNLSMALMVFSIALSAGAGGTRLALSDKGLLLRSFVAMYVVMPLFAVFVALNFELNHAVLVALLLLALSPVPPVLPGKQLKAGGTPAFVLGLFVVAAAAAIFVVPAGVTLIGRIFGRDLMVPWGLTTRVVAISVIVPVAAGLLFARVAPSFAAKSARPVGIVAAALLAVSVLPVLWVARHALAAQVGNFTILAIVLFVAAGVMVGHLLGGPVGDNRTALALANSTRHPGVALGVLHAIEPNNRETAAVILLYLIVAVIATAPYVMWRKRVHAVP
jgi:bile acid:Na+ symporter, BASS family